MLLKGFIGGGALMYSLAASFVLSTLDHHGQRGTLELDQVKAGHCGLGGGLGQ